MSSDIVKCPLGGKVVLVKNHELRPLLVFCTAKRSLRAEPVGKRREGCVCAHSNCRPHYVLPSAASPGHTCHATFRGPQGSAQNAQHGSVHLSHLSTAPHPTLSFKLCRHTKLFVGSLQNTFPCLQICSLFYFRLFSPFHCSPALQSQHSISSFRQFSLIHPG